MKRSFIKIIVYAVFTFAVLLIISSCADVPDVDRGDGTGSETAADSGIDWENVEVDWVYPDYEGYSFTFLTDSTLSSYRLVDDGGSSDIISESIYRRNMLITDKYNLTFAQRRVSDVVTEVRTQVLGGAVDFDVIVADGRKLAALAREGHLCELQKLEKDFYYSADDKYFDFTDPFWDANSVKHLSPGGKTYFLNCDLNVGEFGCVMYYNKKLIEENELTDPIEYVKNGTWTLDKWAELVRSFGSDLDNDGEITELDLYGTFYERMSNRMFLAGIGERISTHDERGYAVLDGFNVNRVTELFEKLKITTEAPYGWFIDDMPVDESRLFDKWSYVRWLFCRDHSLFYYEGTGIIHEFADMESEWGILPFPKYDDEQENYYSLYPAEGALVAVPAVMNDSGMTALILEELNYYSSIVVKPIFFDTLLQRRYVRDDEGEAVLETLYENRVYDMAQLYNFGNIYSDMICSDVRSFNISYTYMRKKAAIEADIKAVYRDFGFEIGG